jgi:hypothetical protein
MDFLWPAGAGDRQELAGYEARAADQSAVDILRRHQFLGVGGLHRAAVENADPLPRFAVARNKLVADEIVHLGDVTQRRGQPGTDGPDRLIGDHQMLGAVRQRAVELRAHNDERISGIALSTCLADADDGEKPGAPRCKRLGAHLRVGLMMILPPLGVTDDNRGRAGIGEHFRGDVAGMGSGGLGVAILPADGDPGSPRLSGEAGNEQKRRADQDVDVLRQLGGSGNDPVQGGRGGGEAVHLPIAGNERTACGHGVSVRRFNRPGQSRRTSAGRC